VARAVALLYLATVRGESRIWSFNNSSSAMRFSPQVGLSAARRRIKFLTSLVTCGLPTGLDFQRQKQRNAARCQPIKVAGLTITNALRQSNQRANFENTNLSAGVVGNAFFSRSRNKANCLRKNRFSAARAKRRRPILAKKLKQSLTIVRRSRTSLESRLKTLDIFAIVSRLTHSFRALIGLLRRTGVFSLFLPAISFAEEPVVIFHVVVD